VNTLLVGGDATPQHADAALRKDWTLADADLELREIPGGLELRTARIFLDPTIARGASLAVPGATGVLTYLVNELRFAERATPYSMVTATEIAGLRDDEIIINSWLADNLGAKVGDELTLKYFVIAEQRKLKEESRSFRISEIKPLDSPDTSWTPPFPGVSARRTAATGILEFPSTRVVSGQRTRITGTNSAAHRKRSSTSKRASRCGRIASEI
jgi:hypothetical protein